MKFDCCKDCLPPKRNAWCHGTCKEYLDDKARHDAEYKMVRQLRAKEDDFVGFKAQTSEAIKRRNGKR